MHKACNCCFLVVQLGDITWLTLSVVPVLSEHCAGHICQYAIHCCAFCCIPYTQNVIIEDLNAFTQSSEAVTAEISCPDTRRICPCCMYALQQPNLPAILPPPAITPSRKYLHLCKHRGHSAVRAVSLTTAALSTASETSNDCFSD